MEEVHNQVSLCKIVDDTSAHMTRHKGDLNILHQEVHSILIATSFTEVWVSHGLKLE